MSTSPVPAKRQVLLASQSARLAPFTRQTTQTLLRILDGELTGLFVEDARLLTAAQLPFTREVGRYSGLVRALECRDLEREFRQHARVFRDELAGLADASSRPWRFEQCQGDVVAAALEALGTNDVAVLAMGEQLPAETRRATASATRMAVLTPHESSASLRTARQLAQALGATLQVMIAHPSAHHPGDARAGRARISDDPEDILAIGDAGSVLLVSASLIPTTPSQRRALLGKLRGLLILVTD